MSTFSQQTKHPVTGEWHEATWIDDFYGRHHYGVRFPNGETFNPDKIQLETRDDELEESACKECNGELSALLNIVTHTNPDYDYYECKSCGENFNMVIQESTAKERFEDAYQRFQLCDKVSAPEMKKLWSFIEKETALAYEQGRNAKGSSFRLGYEAGRSEVVAEERANVVESMMIKGIEASNTLFETVINQYLRNRAKEIGIDMLSIDKPLTDKR